MTWLPIIAAVWLACVAGVLWIVCTAPHGWEDERGFHSGEPD